MLNSDSPSCYRSDPAEFLTLAVATGKRVCCALTHLNIQRIETFIRFLFWFAFDFHCWFSLIARGPFWFALTNAFDFFRGCVVGTQQSEIVWHFWTCLIFLLDLVMYNNSMKNSLHSYFPIYVWAFINFSGTLLGWMHLHPFCSFVL